MLFYGMDHGTSRHLAEAGRLARGVGNLITPGPKAVVVISGHWEEEHFTVTSHSRPPLVYDYYGFPEHTYKIKYEAPGSPALAQKIQELLRNAGLPARSDPERGFDHGVFIPFKLIYPGANIPIVQLSLKTGLDPATHLAAGAALETLRKEGILIVGSGMSYHDLREFGSGFNPVSDRFDAWLTEAVCEPDSGSRTERLRRRNLAPGARNAHPRSEHLLPPYGGSRRRRRGLGDQGVFRSHYGDGRIGFPVRIEYIGIVERHGR